MATLNSPGVQVQVIDESFYTPSAPGTVPMLFVASAQDKTNPSGTIALGTTAANAGKVWLMTGQRDLTDTFGTPVFYTDSSSNPLHGHELNEYGLQTGYSVLGVSSRAYVVRADLDTSQLVPASSAPVGDPVSGTYWVDTANSVFGIKEWNATTLKFTAKTPIVLDDSSPADMFNGSTPATSVGQQGDHCLILTKDNAITMWYKQIPTNNWIQVFDGFDAYGAKSVQISPHYDYPIYNASTATGSVWVTTTTPSNGANWSVKYYNGGTQSWTTMTAPLYDTLPRATHTLDPVGGKNIAVGSVFVETNTENVGTETLNFKLWRRANSGATSVVGNATTALSAAVSYVFTVTETLVSSANWSSPITVTVTPTTSTTIIASLIPAALSSAGAVNVTASFDAATNKLTMSHALGGDFKLADGSGAPLINSGFVEYNMFTQVGTANLYAAPSGDSATFVATNWKPLVYEALPTAPETTPANGRLWYNSVVDEVDVSYHNGTTWVSYHDATAFPNTSPAGPIIAAVAPEAASGQSDGTALVNGDIWISTADLERYGKDIYVYNTTDKWVLQDVTDQETPDGWLFADARWATAGTTLDASAISALLASNYLDPDAPDPALYPKGMRLWNTRRSGFNVKKYVTGYIDTTGTNPRQGDVSMTAYEADRWVSQHNVAADGSGVFGRKAQRAQVVNAFKELIDSNTTIRDTDTLNFNLLATPGYSEAIQNMIALNTDRGITAFVVGDTPFRLAPTGTALNAWGLNTAGALDNGDDGATSYDEYMAMYYPSGYTNDNTGNYIVVPPSHMMLRTILNSDAKSFQWFAPAGTRRGGVDNATSVGYIDAATGEFKSVALYQGLRDVLDSVKINPIATLTGVGLLAYGQRTRARTASSLDRINVARLVCYLRRQLDILARPFLFEPNDAQTRREIKAAAESLMLELVGQRALYDFVVVCDETNNTPARIDRSELYMDIAIEPVKAVEFIYIPLRLKNTGDIAAGL
jgi:hypothetical protein